MLLFPLFKKTKKNISYQKPQQAYPVDSKLIGYFHFYKVKPISYNFFTPSFIGTAHMCVALHPTAHVSPDV